MRLVLPIVVVVLSAWALFPACTTQSVCAHGACDGADGGETEATATTEETATESIDTEETEPTDTDEPTDIGTEPTDVMPRPDGAVSDGGESPGWDASVDAGPRADSGAGDGGVSAPRVPHITASGS